jgi:hypothetical protein
MGIEVNVQMDDIINIESSAQLYRLLSKEDLHLRSGYGRDDVLIRRLARKLKLDPNKPIPKQLESNGTPLEEFVQVFFFLTEPFARILTDVYAIMQRHHVRSTFRSIRMKFSFEKVTKQLDFDIEHFREWLMIYRKLCGTFTVRLWTRDNIAGLYQPVRKLGEIYGEHYDWRKNGHYSSPLPEPQVLYTNPEWAPLYRLRDAMEQLRQIASDKKEDQQSRVFSVSTKKSEKQQAIEYNPSEVRSMLSDLWPGLVGLLSQLDDPSFSKKPTPEAIDALKEIDQVLHKVKRTRTNGKILVRDFVELLRLPFWKYRWRVYEVWIMFKLIECLDEYDVSLESVGERMSLEENRATKVAQFKDSNSSVYEMWTQLKTKVAFPSKRKHIMPDIRLCKLDASIPENTFLVVECKQRKNMKTKDLMDLVKDYKIGAEKGILFLFVNYDAFPAVSVPYSDVELLSDTSPANPKMVQRFRNLVENALMNCGIRPPIQQYDAILFDVSDSMRGKYLASEISNACKDLLVRNPNSKILFFSDHLLATETLYTENLAAELEATVGGSTNLDGALKELTQKHPDIERVAVVTDGGYNSPVNVRELFDVLEELILGRNFPFQTKESKLR